jgi:hypothetical protein
MDDLVAHVRATWDALPHTTCKLSHGRPSWFVKGKNFLVLHPEGHHQNQFPHLWCAAAPGSQEELVAAFPERFFRPPYVGVRGWVGVRLDGDVDAAAVARLCHEAWDAVAPASAKR